MNIKAVIAVFISIVFLAFFILLTGCGTTPEPAPVVEPAPIVEPTPEPIKMSYASGGYWNHCNERPDECGSAASGIITFSVTGFSYSDLPAGKDYFPFMAKFKTSNGNEANFQYNIADLTPRLISQRFDGTCSRFCEHQSHGSVNWNANEIYSFTFKWDTSTVSVEVKDSSGNIVHSGYVATDGEYSQIEFIRIGNGVLSPYPGINNVTIVGVPEVK